MVRFFIRTNNDIYLFSRYDIKQNSFVKNINWVRVPSSASPKENVKHFPNPMRSLSFPSSAPTKKAPHKGAFACLLRTIMQYTDFYYWLEPTRK